MKLFEIPILSMLLVGLCLLSGLDAPPAHADFVFGTPVNLGPNVNTSHGDSGPCLSPDGLTLYFCDVPFDIRPNGRGGQDIWVTTRVAKDAPWEKAVNLGSPLNTSFNEGVPSISSDGLTLYFSSTRPGGFGSTDLWMTTRPTTSDPWGTPTNLGATVDSRYSETMPSISADGLELYFGEGPGEGIRPGGYGDLDIWVTTRKAQQDPWGIPRNLGPTVNSSFGDTSPHISPDGRMLLFWSQRPGGYGSTDIWMARRAGKDDPWGTPVNVGVPVNTSTHDDLPCISRDGSTLYFASAREGGYGFYDIWQAPILPIVDFNADGNVDLTDLATLIDNWGTDNTLYDIGPFAWGDGKVDIEDLKVFIAEWEDWEKQNPPAQADFVFGTVANLGPPVNGPYRDAWSVLSSDGLELFFSSERSGGYGGLDIWVTKRATMEDPWGPPSDLGPAINVSTYDLATSISPDGLTLYFSTSSNDLMYTTSRPARDAPWGPPSIMAPATAGGGGAAGPVSADGLEFYFCSTRPGGYGVYDIWVSTRASTSEAWGPGVNLGLTINTADSEVPTWLSPDGLTLLLTSDRPGGYGGYDAWITTRPSKGAAWGPPRNLGPSINTPYTDEITAISPDGRWCLLDDWLSPRPGGCGQWDIWQAPIIPTVDVNGDGKLDSEDLKVLTAE